MSRCLAILTVLFCVVGLGLAVSDCGFYKKFDDCMNSCAKNTSLTCGWCSPDQRCAQCDPDDEDCRGTALVDSACVDGKNATWGMRWFPSFMAVNHTESLTFLRDCGQYSFSRSDCLHSGKKDGHYCGWADLVNITAVEDNSANADGDEDPVFYVQSLCFPARKVDGVVEFVIEPLWIGGLTLKSIAVINGPIVFHGAESKEWVIGLSVGIVCAMIAVCIGLYLIIKKFRRDPFATLD